MNLRNATPGIVEFEKIYQAAKLKNRVAVEAILTDGGTLDRQHPDLYITPAEKLASENDKDSAEFLRLLGANVNCIARGAAQVANHQYVINLMQIHFASVNFVAQGAAFAGLTDYVSWLRANYTVNINDVAAGAVVGGHQHYAEQLRLRSGANVTALATIAASVNNQKYAEFLRLNHGANAKNIATGAALAGNHEYANYLKLMAGAMAGDIALGAVMHGDYEYVEALIRENNTDMNQLIIGAAKVGDSQAAATYESRSTDGLSYKATGMAWGGHRHQSEVLRLSAVPNQIANLAKGSALGCHDKYLDLLTTHGLTNLTSILFHSAYVGNQQRSHRDAHEAIIYSTYIASGSAQGGQLDFCEREFMRRSSHYNLMEVAKHAIKGAHFANESLALHALTFMQNDRFREALSLQIARHSFLNFNIQKAALRANRMSALMKTEQLDYDQANAATSPELQIWFLQGIQLVKQSKLHAVTFRLISSFLSPLTSEKDLDKTRFFLQKKHVAHLLAAHHKKTNRFSLFNQRDEMISLRDECKTKQAREEMTRAIGEAKPRTALLRHTDYIKTLDACLQRIRY